MKKVNIVLAIVTVALLIILAIILVSRVDQPVTIPAPDPHPTLNQAEQAQLSAALAKMYPAKPETTPEPVRAVLPEELKPRLPVETTPEPTYTEEELELLALVIYQEAGGDTCSDETRLRVGCVVLNRVDHPDFPDTIYDVVTEERAYGELYWTGPVWPKRASWEGEADAVARSYDIAERVLEGERVLPEDVIFQSEYIMGEIVAYSDGMYFCR